MNLKQATTKYSQTLGVLKRVHVTIKTSFKMALAKYSKQGDKYLPIPRLKYITSYQSSIDCETSRVFRDRVPNNILNH